jgi:serine/tyrosine/threonine adenylyltransferase
VRLGESMHELIGAGAGVDAAEFIEKGVRQEDSDELIARAEALIGQAGEEYKALFLSEYKRLMTLRLGLKWHKESDFQSLFSELLDTMEALELDFNQFFRKLSGLQMADLDSEDKRRDVAGIFFHHEGVTGLGNTEESARKRLGSWLDLWKDRVLEDWGANSDEERQKAMKLVNPKFIPKSWVLDELIRRVEKGGEREVLARVLNMALHPFEESWGGDKDEEGRFCGDVPREGRAMMCSCSS